MFWLGFAAGIVVTIASIVVLAFCLSAEAESRLEELTEDYENTDYPEPVCWNCSFRNTPEGFWKCDQCVAGSQWEPVDS